MKPASEYAHQINIMNMAGMSQVEIAKAIGAAWKNTGDIVTTTATENLKSLLDLRNILGNVDEARMALPIVSRIQAVMQSSKEGAVSSQAHDFAFSMAKALDILGAANDPARFEREADMMAKVITAYQGRVTPQMFQSVFAYSRQAKFGLGDEFKYTILPTLMLEYAMGRNYQGGGSRGVGPALGAFSRLTLQGYISKKALPELHRLGLVDSSTALRTTTQGTTVGPMKGHELAASNPYAWVQTYLLPAIERKYGGHATRDQITQEILMVTRGNQLASQIILEFALKQKNFMRDQGIIRGAMSPDQAYRAAMQNDPQFAYSALAAQWENLKTAFGISVIPIIIPAMMSLTRGLNDFSQWAMAHPRLTDGLVYSFTALSAAMAFGGTVLTMTAAFKGLGLVLTLGGFGTALTSAATGARVLMAALGPLIAIAGAAVWLKHKAELESQPGHFNAGNPWWDTLPGGTGKIIDFLRGPLKESIVSAIQEGFGGMKVVLDGRTVGRIVGGALAVHGSGPSHETSKFDGAMSPAAP